jgi:hypothetical protein
MEDDKEILQLVRMRQYVTVVFLRVDAGIRPLDMFT